MQPKALLPLFLAVLSSIAFGQVQSAEVAFQRWAIIATQPVTNDGLTDLLTAQLSKDATIQLVERDRLNEVTRELQLSTLLEAASEHRLQLGKMIGADALLLLTVEERQDKPVLRVVVSDCRYGARLRSGYFRYRASDLEPTVQQCVSMINDVRRQFPTQIQYIVGVSPFLSKNLTREYDRMQVAYARFLEQALLTVPGVAVLEFEEARAIQRELALVARQMDKRIVPLLVDGEYEMKYRADNEMPNVDLTIRLSSHDAQLQTLLRRTLPLDDVPDLLSGDVARSLLQRTNFRPLEHRQQVDLIGRRAEEFGELGIWERSLGLREAVLLLEPTLVEQRLVLLAEREHLWKSRQYVEEQKLLDAERHPKLWSTFRDGRRSDWRIRMEHVEYLIRNRLVNPREAGYLVKTVMQFREHLRPDEEDLDVGEDFFWRMFRLIPGLDYSLAAGKVRRGLEQSYDRINLRPEIWSKPKQMERWISDGYEILFEQRRISRPSIERANPAEASRLLRERVQGTLYRFFMDVVPAEGAPGWLALWQSEYNRKEYRQLYQRLTETEHVGAQVFGRYRLLRIAAEDGEKEPDQSLLADANSLLQFVDSQTSLILRDYRNPVLGIREQVTARLARTPGKVAKLRPLTILEPYQFDTLHRVAFAPTGMKSDGWLSLERCHESLDLLYSEYAVYVMREPRQLTAIWTSENRLSGDKAVYEARWDGENIWIALTVGGILVYSPAGQLLAKFDRESGLPPYQETSERHPTNYLLIHPLAAGRVLAVGTFGTDDRVWFAELVLRPKARERINLFHRLTKLHGQRDDPELISNVAWIKPYQLANDPMRLLVKRQYRGADPPFPLIIDPETLKVSVHPVQFDLSLAGKETNWYGRRFSILPSGDVLHPVGFGVERFSFGQGWNWRQPPNLFIRGDIRGVDGWIERDGEILYCAGDWYRIDARKLMHERLTNGIVPPFCQFTNYGVSAHHGLVGWNASGPLVQVLIDPSSPPADPLTPHEWVPDANRNSHARAAEKLAQLGAIVGPTVCREKRPESTPYPLTQYIRQGAVCLPETWRGQPDDLKLLAELHDLTELDFRRATISNGDLAQLPPLHGLKKLTLYETRVNDQGLVHLSPDKLPELEYVRVEDAVGRRDFTNRSLQDLTRFSKLKELALFGAGFSDEGLDFLAAHLPQDCQLTLHGTSLTREALARLRAKRPDVSSYEEP